jgi:hypothetical protein
MKSNQVLTSLLYYAAFHFGALISELSSFPHKQHQIIIIVVESVMEIASGRRTF